MKRLLVFLLLLVSITTNAEIEKTLTYRSPDKRWSVVAQWTDTNRGGYLWELRDGNMEKTYFKEEKTTSDAFPYRFNAEWTRDGHYVAINVLYGRITYDVLVIDVSGKEPREISLFPKNVKAYDDCALSGHWLNHTDLEVEAFDISKGLGHSRRKNVVIRFSSQGNSIVKQQGWHD